MDQGEHLPVLLNNLERDRQTTQRYCDITLVVNDVEFAAHRIVLASFSGYFDTLFESSFSEKQDGVVHLSGPIDNELSAQDIETVLDFMYKKKLKLTTNNSLRILHASEYLQIDKLKTECIDFIGSRINSDSWLDTYRLGVKLCNEGLIQKCIKKFGGCVSEIDYTDFEYNEIFHVLDEQNGRTNSKFLFLAVISWATLQPDVSLAEEFQELMAFIDFDSMEVSYIQDCVMKQDLVLQCNYTLQRVAKVCVEKLCLLESEQPRMNLKSETEIVVFGGVDYVSHCTSCQKFYSGQDFYPFTSSNMDQVTAVSEGSFAYFFRGTNQYDGFDICVYSYNDDKYFSCDEKFLQVQRIRAAASVMNGFIYICGGQSPVTEHPLNSVEILTVDDERVLDIMTAGFTLDQSRCEHAVLGRQEVLYVLGGSAHNMPLASVEAIRVSDGSRLDFPPMLEPRCAFAAVHHGDSFIVSGGKGIEDSLCKVESYSFSTNQWSCMLSMNITRFAHSACIANGKMFIVGGADKSNNNIESYDFTAKEWTVGAELPEIGTWCSVMAGSEEICRRPYPWRESGRVGEESDGNSSSESS